MMNRGLMRSWLLWSWPCQWAHHRFKTVGVRRKVLPCLISLWSQEKLPRKIEKQKGTHSNFLNTWNSSIAINIRIVMPLRIPKAGKLQDFRDGCYQSLWQVNVLANINCCLRSQTFIDILHFPKTLPKITYCLYIKWKQTNAQLACLSQIVERRLNESPAFLSQRLYSTLLSSKTREKAKAFANIGLNQTTSKHGEMSNLLPCCHSWRKMQKCVLFCRARSWHTSLRLNTRQEHSENSNLNKWQTDWTKKTTTKCDRRFLHPVTSLYVARCSLLVALGFLGLWLGSLLHLQLSDLLAQGFHLTSTWVNLSCHHVNMSTTLQHFKFVHLPSPPCQGRSDRFLRNFHSDWQGDKTIQSWQLKKKANKVVKIHELCWCLPFQESCMPMSWLWRDSKTPHGFYLIKLRKFQLKKRTVSFSRLQHFAIHSHQWRPHQLQGTFCCQCDRSLTASSKT